MAEGKLANLNKYQNKQATPQLKQTVNFPNARQSDKEALAIQHDDNIVTGYKSKPEALKAAAAPEIPADDANVITGYHPLTNSERLAKPEEQPVQTPTTEPLAASTPQPASPDDSKITSFTQPTPITAPETDRGVAD